MIRSTKYLRHLCRKQSCLYLRQRATFAAHTSDWLHTARNVLAWCRTIIEAISHGRNGSALEEISRILMHSQNVQIGVAIIRHRCRKYLVTLIYDTTVMFRRTHWVRKALPWACRHGAGPSLKLSHSQIGAVLEEISGILVHTRRMFSLVSQILVRLFGDTDVANTLLTTSRRGCDTHSRSPYEELQVVSRHGNNYHYQVPIRSP